LRYNTPTESVLLYQDEKGPIVAKTYGGTSWSPVQSKIEKAQKINGILNIFGVYDHTNDQMYTHSYRKKTGKQFLDFIKQIDQKYNSDIKQIFLVLDNISIHRSKKVRETIQKYYPRINLVFLPTRAPELNLIEVRWMWMQRQAVNNSTFENECDIGKAVTYWTRNYNKKHGRIIINILQEETTGVFT
jgi:transposase